MTYKYIWILVLSLTALSACVKDRVLPELDLLYKQAAPPILENRELIHYWNFNSSGLLAPTRTAGGAAISYTGGSGIADAVSPGTDLNAREGDEAGGALRLRNPAGVFTLDLPTTRYQDVIFSFDVQRTNNGAELNTLSYSIDGTTFISTGLSPAMHQVSIDWQTFSYDFTGIPEVDNNPDFKIRITFDLNSTGDSGNNRYDNITLDGNVIQVEEGEPALTETELIHYWDFNNSSSSTPSIIATTSTGGASLQYNGTWDGYNTGSLVNARAGSEAGWALRLRNPAGTFTLDLPTTGFRNIQFSLAVQRTNNGSATNTLSYTLDGTNYITTGIIPNTYAPELEPAYGLVRFDFTDIAGANDNPNFKIRIDFSDGSTGSSGNNRFDNIVLEGVRL